jgi:hypothetical protein
MAANDTAEATAQDATRPRPQGHQRGNPRWNGAQADHRATGLATDGGQTTENIPQHGPQGDPEGNPKKRRSNTDCRANRKATPSGHKHVIKENHKQTTKQRVNYVHR